MDERKRAYDFYERLKVIIAPYCDFEGFNLLDFVEEEFVFDNHLNYTVRDVLEDKNLKFNKFVIGSYDYVINFQSQWRRFVSKPFMSYDKVLFLPYYGEARKVGKELRGRG